MQPTEYAAAFLHQWLFNSRVRWFVVHARFGGLLPLCLKQRRKSRRDEENVYFVFFERRAVQNTSQKGQKKKYHRCSIVRSIRLLDDRQKWRSQELPAGPTTSHHIGLFCAGPLGMCYIITTYRNIYRSLLSSSDWKDGNKPLVNFWLFLKVGSHFSFLVIMSRISSECLHTITQLFQLFCLL